MGQLDLSGQTILQWITVGFDGGNETSCYTPQKDAPQINQFRGRRELNREVKREVGFQIMPNNKQTQVEESRANKDTC